MYCIQVLFAFMVGLHNLYWYYGAQYLISESNISLPLFTGTNLRLSDYSFTIAKQLWVSCSKTIVPHLTPIRSSNSLLLANIHGHIIVTHKYVNTRYEATNKVNWNSWDMITDAANGSWLLTQMNIQLYWHLTEKALQISNT
jgi:hypothetical protein